jgi:hypothetical protein
MPDPQPPLRCAVACHPLSDPPTPQEARRQAASLQDQLLALATTSLEELRHQLAGEAAPWTGLAAGDGAGGAAGSLGLPAPVVAHIKVGGLRLPLDSRQAGLLPSPHAQHPSSTCMP